MCRSCGTKAPAGARFCGACGVRLATDTDAAEYKHVTVLFADVERSMDIAAALDIERLREVMTELVERSTTVLRRYGGTVEFNGDGVMALFGAPVALEDHAFRACMAALEVQGEAARLAAEVKQRDDIDFRVRVGLNSGRVIAGEIGSGAFGYRAIGETVGFAQRMESVAPPGGVMLSESTARLVEDLVMLGGLDQVRIKGADQPVAVRQLLGIRPRSGGIGRVQSSLVGRSDEMAAIEAALDSATDGRGGVLNVVAPPGIGKSRSAREAAALATARGFEVIWVFCESHARDISFGVIARLLRAATGVADLDGQDARARTRSVVPEADPQDVQLLDDLLGIADPEAVLPVIEPDARRRRLTALVHSASLTRTRPALVIVEDVQWIDAVSESMLCDFLAVIDQSPTLVLITSRPEYAGALVEAPGSRVIQLAPLGDSDIAALLDELLGPDPAMSDLTAIIADRAAGNPFFAEEIVRELAQRGVLAGERGDYRCRGDVSEVTVPATVQAAIAARIDRLGPAARYTLNAASVIGERFGADLLAALDVDAEFAELLNTELIDQVQFTPAAEYAFHHPLIRAVAYEAQLKSGRSEWHRRLAAAIERSAPDSVDENAALIAEHLDSAGDLHAAYGWQMRAAAWSVKRDITAARLRWDRAYRIGKRLPEDRPTELSMRIAPLTMLCATDFHAKAAHESRGRFAELRQLCAIAGDKVSLAIGMTGLVTEHLYVGRGGEAARLASEQMALLESIGDANLTVGLGFVAFATWFDQGEFDEMLRWTQTVIDLAAGDATKGNEFGFGSPLAAAITFRGVARWWLGRAGWREDLDVARAMARNSDPATFGYVLAWTYCIEIAYGVLLADDVAVQASDDAVQTAERLGNDYVLLLAEYGLGVTLAHRDDLPDRQRGLELMEKALALLRVRIPSLVPVTALWVARDRARVGDRDTAITVMREAVDELYRESRLGYFVAGVANLVETLIDRGADGDLADAELAIDQIAGMKPDDVSAIREVTLLRLRALLARARADPSYRDWVRRYRAMAESLGYDGHIAWATAMDVGER
ncbi:adenylate/guanylate cyclase domain-containing protein [Mycolicibacterium helvum]|uniref:adenylate/guanylate cyclase domain-containing protein n=1 Tax=Mycolicibacterium helvum TaxID=1534349 RepID=UPI0013D727B4|nr:adenylate/guanylate cyclase domain-containing protein [Mycolicibacterium helvum]